MKLTVNDQRKLLDTAADALAGLFDVIYDEATECSWMLDTMKVVESNLSKLRESMCDEETYVRLRDRETGEISVRHFDEDEDGLNALCTFVSKIYCFNDCDDTYEIEEIIYRNRAIRYMGWKPNMEFEFRYSDIDEVVWEGCFPDWDH